MIQSTRHPKIAFTGWNPFQFRHIKNIARLLPGSIFLVEDRNNGNLSAFPDDFFENYQNPVVVVNKGDIHKFDGIFDAFVTQVTFPGIQKIEKSKIIMIQYGYAKEPHNYGVWRALACLNITYGPYASEKIGYYTPIAECGNPEVDDWENPNFHTYNIQKYKQQLDPLKKTILYAPTWGDLSSVDLYLNSILALHNKYNIILKIHHNTDLIEKHREYLKNTKNILIYGASENIFSLLSISDIMISDYSGAIFDGYYCKIPLILLNTPTAYNSKKMDDGSLELSQRESLGSIVHTPKELANFEQLYQKAQQKVGGKLLEELFVNFHGQNSQKAAYAILDACAGKYQLTNIQRYIQEVIRKIPYNSFK